MVLSAKLVEEKFSGEPSAQGGWGGAARHDCWVQLKVIGELTSELTDLARSAQAFFGAGFYHLVPFFHFI